MKNVRMKCEKGTLFNHKCLSKVPLATRSRISYCLTVKQIEFHFLLGPMGKRNLFREALKNAELISAAEGGKLVGGERYKSSENCADVAKLGAVVETRFSLAFYKHECENHFNMNSQSSVALSTVSTCKSFQSVCMPQKVSIKTVGLEGQVHKR